MPCFHRSTTLEKRHGFNNSRDHQRWRHRQGGGLDGLLYRACNGNRCVNCFDLITALEHLKVWRQKLL